MNEFKVLESVLSDFDKQKISPVYFIIGDEEYFKEKIIKKAESVLVQASTKDFNLDIFYGAESSDSQILNACYSLPMMSSNRLVIVNDFEQISFQDPEAFIKYFQNPVKETTLILVAKKEDKRKKIFSDIHKHAFVVNAEAPKNEQSIINWLKEKIAAKNIVVDDEAIHLFYEHVGNHLFYLENQLNKLEIFVNEKETITVKVIEDMIGVSKEFSVFELIRQLIERNQKKVHEILNILLEQGQDAISVIAAMYYRFQKQLLVGQAILENKTDKEIASQCGIRPFMVKEYRAAAKKFNRRQTERALNSLYESDKRLKSSSNNPKDLLTITIQKILEN